MESILENSKPIRVDEAGFDADVLQSERPVLVAFLTEWSRACHALEPVLDEIVSSCPEKLKVVRVNVDENPDLGLLYDIHAVPTLILFVAGSVRGRLIGTATKAAILSKFHAFAHAKAHLRRHQDA